MDGQRLMEELYHVDKDDSVVGPVKRDVAHKEGVLHRAGMLFLVRSDGRILITRRSPSKDTFPYAYDSSCAFHVSFGESYEEAARRELFEETGIHSAPEYVGKFSFHEAPENEMVAVFKSASNDPVKLDRTESIDSHWHSTIEVDRIVASQRVTPWLRDGWKIVRPHLG